MSEEYITSELSRLKLCTSVDKIKPLAGGCISQAMCYSTDTGEFFVKTNADKKASQWFIAESMALERIHETVPGFVPRPIYHNNTAEPPFIVTEFIHMSNAHKSLPSIQRKLGQSLAQLHCKNTKDKFGFDVTSFCGTTQLNNAWNSNWSDFFKNQRLLPLFTAVMGQNQDLDTLGRDLCARIEHWLGDLMIQPCLLHGDLWNGNWSVTSDTHSPVIFDPASYYGHHEAEFGIMKMFGGFTSDCFDAYETAMETHDDGEGREDRLVLYEIYNHLNHFAMFGEGYETSCLQLIEKLL